MKRLADKPFILLGVNSDEDRETLQKTIEEEDIVGRSWWDGSIDGPIHTKWQIALRPAIHLIDHKGVIRFKEIEPEEVDEAIDSLLKELADEQKRKS